MHNTAACVKSSNRWQWPLFGRIKTPYCSVSPCTTEHSVSTCERRRGCQLCPVTSCTSHAKNSNLTNTAMNLQHMWAPVPRKSMSELKEKKLSFGECNSCLFPLGSVRPGLIYCKVKGYFTALTDILYIWHKILFGHKYPLSLLPSNIAGQYSGVIILNILNNGKTVEPWGRSSIFHASWDSVEIRSYHWKCTVPNSCSCSTKLMSTS